MPAGELGLVVDEFNRGNSPGGKMGAQVLMKSGFVIPVAELEFPNLFNVRGYCQHYYDYQMESVTALKAQHESGYFDRIFKDLKYKVLYAPDAESEKQDGGVLVG